MRNGEASRKTRILRQMEKAGERSKEGQTDCKLSERRGKERMMERNAEGKKAREMG